MKIISWNVNGLRSVHRKGFVPWLLKTNPDILCLQEIKAQKNQLSPELIRPQGYQAFFHSAAKKGYSGTSIFTKEKPISVKKKIGLKPFDQEGRFLQLNFPSFTLINLYLPHGQRDKGKLPYKLKTYHHLFAYFKKLKKQKSQSLILAGDFNIAHQEIDLARPIQNKNNIMFTPQERKQIDHLFNLKLIDTFRHLHPRKQAFSWWPYTHHARERNIGWRLDYVFVSEKTVPKISQAFILKKVTMSDHCPVGIKIIN